MPATGAWCILAAEALGRHMRGRIRRRQHRPQTLALRYSAGPRAALNTGLSHDDVGLDVRDVLPTAGQALPMSASTTPARTIGPGGRGQELNGIRVQLDRTGGGRGRILSCVRSELHRPRADRQRTGGPGNGSCAAALHDTCDLRLRARPLAGVHSKARSDSVLEVSDSLACMDFGVQGSNVRHERRAKGREAAFGTSARWRG